MSDERALNLISQQGFGTAKGFGPNAPTTVKQILDILNAASGRLLSGRPTTAFGKAA
jgi:IclR family acetate operon transcriptional repressor